MSNENSYSLVNVAKTFVVENERRKKIEGDTRDYERREKRKGEQKSKRAEKRTRWRKSGENEVQSLMWKIASHEMKVWKLKQFYIYVL